jgi:hypothetical protein
MLEREREETWGSFKEISPVVGGRRYVERDAGASFGPY